MARFMSDPSTTTDTLFDQPATETPKAPAARPNFNRNNPAASRVRSNAYAAPCATCRVVVPAGQGTLTNQAGQWIVRHVQPCPTEDAPAPQAPASKTTGWKVPDGTYTVVWDDHHKTVRVRTQDESAEFMPGRVILSHLTGSNNDTDYTRFAHVDDQGNVRIWKRFVGVEGLRESVKVLVGDPKAASQAYAQESGACSRCGRTLTVPSSLHAGLGPECARKVQW